MSLLSSNDDYFDPNTSREMKEVRKLFETMYSLLLSMDQRIQLLDQRISSLEEETKRATSFSDLKEKIVYLEDVIGVSNKNMKTMGDRVSALSAQIGDIDNQLKDITRSINKVSLQNGSVYHRIVNTMIRGKDPIPFSLSSCIQQKDV